MDKAKKNEIIEKARDWFEKEVVKIHLNNSKKLTSSNKFIINPFTTLYLARLLKGDLDADGLARALLYPRVLGTSIATTFGNKIQSFVANVLGCVKSSISGIDIEFEDYIDKKHKYCQLKSGPNTINKDDVTTIANHFKTIKSINRTNGGDLSLNQLIVGVVYGCNEDLSNHYKSLIKDHNYQVFAGRDFWYRLTGDSNFYFDLLKAIKDVSGKLKLNDELENIIGKLAKDEEIIKLSKLN